MWLVVLVAQVGAAARGRGPILAKTRANPTRTDKPAVTSVGGVAAHTAWLADRRG